MEALKLFHDNRQLDWEYDEEADVLYVSSGNPVKALGVDLGDGLVLRVDSDDNVVGMTVIGLRERLAKSNNA